MQQHRINHPEKNVIPDKKKHFSSAMSARHKSFKIHLAVRSSRSELVLTQRTPEG